jgi:hypothetical protein
MKTILHVLLAVLLAVVFGLGCKDSDSLVASTTAGGTDLLPNDPNLLQTDIVGLKNIQLGNATKLFAVSKGGVPPYRYTWSTGDTAIAATLSPTATGTYTVTVVDKRGDQTTTDATITVTLPPVEPTPEPFQVFVNGHPLNIQEGGTTTLIASATGGKPPYTFKGWNVGTTIASVAKFSPSVTTTYVATYVDSVGTERNGLATVSVTPKPVVIEPPVEAFQTFMDASPPNIMEGDTTVLSIAATGGRKPYAFMIEGRNVTTLRVTPHATYTYVGSGKDLDGRTFPVSFTVSVTPKPVIILPTPPQFKAYMSIMPPNATEGDTVSVSLSATGGTPPYTYWIDGKQVRSLKDVPPTPGRTYNGRALDSKGNEIMPSGTVIVKAKPVVPVVTPDPLDVSITANPPNIMEGDSTILAIFATGGTKPYSFTLNGRAASMLTVAPTATHTYVGSVVDSTGNTRPAAITVTVTPKPVVVEPLVAWGPTAYSDFYVQMGTVGYRKGTMANITGRTYVKAYVKWVDADPPICAIQVEYANGTFVQLPLYDPALAATRNYEGWFYLNLSPLQLDGNQNFRLVVLNGATNSQVHLLQLEGVTTPPGK